MRFWTIISIKVAIKSPISCAGTFLQIRSKLSSNDLNGSIAGYRVQLVMRFKKKVAIKSTKKSCRKLFTNPLQLESQRFDRFSIAGKRVQLFNAILNYQIYQSYNKIPPKKVVCRNLFQIRGNFSHNGLNSSIAGNRVQLFMRFWIKSHDKLHWCEQGLKMCCAESFFKKQWRVLQLTGAQPKTGLPVLGGVDIKKKKTFYVRTVVSKNSNIWSDSTLPIVIRSHCAPFT